MKVIKPSVEIMRTGMESEFCTPVQFIERVGRTCYKSEDKIMADSANKFVGALVKRGHEAMLEHWNLIFKCDHRFYHTICKDYYSLVDAGAVKQFLRFTKTERNRCIISGNMRAWRDYIKAWYNDGGYTPTYLHSMISKYPTFFPEFQDTAKFPSDDVLTPIDANDLIGPVEHSVHHCVTVKFICDRGVSHEIVRHRTASFAQESTRYCNYSGDKFGNEITVIEPSWCDPTSEEYDIWVKGCVESQYAYFNLLDAGRTPQEARSVLPNSLKTELVMTANLDCWKHFFELRCAPDAHPDIRVVAKMAREKFDELGVPGFEKER